MAKLGFEPGCHSPKSTNKIRYHNNSYFATEWDNLGLLDGAAVQQVVVSRLQAGKYRVLF